LGDIIVKGLGLRNDQYEASMREIYERVFLSEREREREVFPWQRANILCSCSYVFGTSLMKVNTHALIIREED
jgi:hypothetical protein